MKTDKKWYLAINERVSGPYSRQDLLRKANEGDIDVGSLVFAEGMSGWEPITNRSEFADAFPTIPPLPSGSSETPNQEAVRHPPIPPTSQPQPRPPRRFGFFRFALALALGAGGFYAAQYTFFEAGLRIFPDPQLLAYTGAAAGLVLGLLFFRPFSARRREKVQPVPRRSRHKERSFSLSGIFGVLLGAVGLYAAYFTYDPPQWEAYGVADGATYMGMSFSNREECLDWAKQELFRLGQTMNANPQIQYEMGGFKGLNCRQFCFGKWPCLLQQVSGRR